MAATIRSSVADRWRLLGCGAQRATVAAFQHLVDHKRVATLSLLRRHRPVLSVRRPRMAVVSRRDDVLAVLADPDTFANAYSARLPGPFLLGLEGNEHERHAAELRAVLRPEDVAGLGEQAGAVARDAVTAGQSCGYLDVGADLVRPALARAVTDYLGVPAPHPDTLWRWGLDIFEDIFLNVSELPALRQQGQAAGAQMSAYVDALIADRCGSGDLGDDVLGRLLARQQSAPETALDDREISYTLLGLAIGWLYHGARAAIIAVDELLDRPDALTEARAAAAAGNLDRLRSVLWEVLRFRAVQLGVLRTCLRDTEIAPGTDRASAVAAGTTVIVGTHSAMWDEDTVPQPDRFDARRAGSTYLIFGSGVHRCAGEQIMSAQLPSMLAPLLALPGLRRQAGSAGRLHWTGPRPDGLVVTVQ